MENRWCVAAKDKEVPAEQANQYPSTPCSKACSRRSEVVLVAKEQEGHDVGDVTETKGRHAAQGWLWEGKEFCEQEITDAAQGHPDGDQQAEGRERSVLCEEVPAPGCKHQGT